MCRRAGMLCLFLVMAAGILTTAGPSAAALPPGGIKVSFTWSPQEPLTGQPVTFTSTSAAGTGNAITAQQWDLDDDGKFDDHSGRKATTSFSSPGSHVVTLRVVDSHGATHNHVRAETVTVLPLNQPPAASFGYHPAPPVAGQAVSFYSTATDPDSPIAVQRWDLDGNGSYGDALGPAATHSFPSLGSYVIGLQVVDTVGAVSTAVGTVVVSSATASLASRPLFPSPVVRLSGTSPRPAFASAGSQSMHRLGFRRPFVAAGHAARSPGGATRIAPLFHPRSFAFAVWSAACCEVGSSSRSS